MVSDSYAESLENVLKSARENPLPEKQPEKKKHPREELLRAAALAAVMSMIDSVDDRSALGRQLGSAWSQDHRRTRMGNTSLRESRQQRATWR